MQRARHRRVWTLVTLMTAIGLDVVRSLVGLFTNDSVTGEVVVVDWGVMLG